MIRQGALQTAVSIRRLGLVDRLCWDALDAVHGPLSALYGADDGAQRQYFLGADVEKWHPSVIDQKRAALDEAAQVWKKSVRTSCEALRKYGAKQGAM